MAGDIFISREGKNRTNLMEEAKMYTKDLIHSLNIQEGKILMMVIN